MMNPADYFSSDYFTARERFLTLAQSHTGDTRSYPIEARGPASEMLSIDTAYYGGERPRRLLIVSCGTHGVEGFAGSALQCRFLSGFNPGSLSDDEGILFIHALNPYGFAHLRRANENNVDLNRNNLARFPGPPNSAYARLNPWLNPPTPPGGVDLFLVKGVWLMLRQGGAALKQAIAGGQYDFPQGIFYGGRAQEKSLSVLEQILRDPRLLGVERVLHLDLHTGLGHSGSYKLLVDFPADSTDFKRLATWFGEENVASNHPETSIAYTVSGLLSQVTETVFDRAQVFPIVLEFGTYNIVRLMRVLCAENRFYFHGDQTSPAATLVRRELLEVFCPRDPNWRRRFLENGMRVLAQAAATLSHNG